MIRYVDIPTLAAVAGVGNRALERAIERIQSGKATTWRGAALKVRQVHGQGGRSGIRYEARADSLPPYLQERLKAALTPVEDPSKALCAHQPLVEWKMAVATESMKHPAGSPQRRETIKAYAGMMLVTPDGKRRNFSERTITRWVADVERDGFRPLYRKERDDKSNKRVYVARRWHKGVNPRRTPATRGRYRTCRRSGIPPVAACAVPRSRKGI